MPNYFDQRRSLKSMISYARNGIIRLEKVRAKHEERAEQYRNMLFSSEFMNICNNPRHPQFKAAQAQKQSAFYLMGEEKYLLYECNQEIESLRRRLKLYKQWMQPYID